MSNTQSKSTAPLGDIFKQGVPEQPGVAVSPDSIEKKAENFLAKYMRSNLRPLTPTQVYRVRAELLAGNDPLILAMKYAAPFTNVAKLANGILKERSGLLGREPGQIPEDLNSYITLLLALAQANDDIQKKDTAVETGRKDIYDSAVESTKEDADKSKHPFWLSPPSCGNVAGENRPL